MIVERNGPPLRSFSVREDDGTFVEHLPFRDVAALVAVRNGHARARLRTRRWFCFSDVSLEPECDLFGIGYGTIVNLQTRWSARRDAALIATPEEEGRLKLTILGDAVLDAVLATEGTAAIEWAGPEPVGATA